MDRTLVFGTNYGSSSLSEGTMEKEEDKWIVVKLGQTNMFFANQEQYNEYLDWMAYYEENMRAEEGKIVWGTNPLRSKKL